jgi:hypothetical protein
MSPTEVVRALTASVLFKELFEHTQVRESWTGQNQERPAARQATGRERQDIAGSISAILWPEMHLLCVEVSHE